MRDKRERWKGIEPIAENAREYDLQPETESDAIPLGHSRSSNDDKSNIDMTPMVDVTFLLLIFFMITASFVMIRSVQHPLPSTDEVSKLHKEKDQRTFVECVVDQHGSFHIVSPQTPPVEAAGILEMRQVLRSAIEDHSPERLVITTHEESTLKRMMAVYSTGRLLGMDSIELKSTSLDY